MRHQCPLNYCLAVAWGASLFASALSGCEPPREGKDAATSTPDSSSAADAAPTDSAPPTDSATGEAETASAAECTAATPSACDDKNPCTADTCVGDKCSHTAIAAGPCDDGDPCTVEDGCGANGCTGKKKDCDDKESCTKDACELDGKCSHTHNMHEDCLPIVQVDSPPRGLRLAGSTASVLVKGAILPTATTPTGLTIQGVPVPLAKDGSFTAQVPLKPGAQTLVLRAVDQLGGEKVRIQGIHYAPEWKAPGEQVAAGAIAIGSAAISAGKGAPPQAWNGAYNDQLAIAGFAVLPAYGSQQVLVKLGLASAIPASPAGWPANTLVLTGQPLPVAAPLPWPATGVQDLGVPVSSECGNSPGFIGIQDGFTGVQHLVSRDLVNAALRAAWQGGAMSGDVSALVAGLEIAEGVTADLQARPLMPWLLQGCSPADVTLRLLDFNVRVTALAGGDKSSVVGHAWVHVQVNALAKWVLANGKLQLWLGKMEEIAAETTTDVPKFQGTDAHLMFSGAASQLVIPMLLDLWAKAPLVEVALPQGLEVGGVKVGWSQAGAGELGAGGFWWGAAVK